MTEEEWLSAASSGRLLEQIKRLPKMPPQVRGRKYRLAAIAMAREYLRDSDPSLVPVIEAVERLCESECSLADVSRVIQDAGFPVLSGHWAHWGPLAGHLGDPDSFSSVRGVAGATQLGWEQEAWPSRSISEEFLGIQCHIIREIFGNPFQLVEFSPDWRTDTAVALARQMYESREFGAMPILADALQDAGCDNEAILDHCRDANQVHVRGCWVVDLVLGKA